MSNDYTDYDDRPGRSGPGGPTFPKSVKTAGYLWITLGVIGILLQIANIVVNKVLIDVPVAQNQAEAAGQATGQVCGMACGMLFAAAFIFVGVQTVRGSARDTLGNSIGSLIFSAFPFFLGSAALLGGIALMALANNPRPGSPVVPQILIIFLLVGGVVYLLIGGMLLLAGILALVGRSRYKEWRAFANPAPRRRPTRREDDYDDR